MNEKLHMYFNFTHVLSYNKVNLRAYNAYLLSIINNIVIAITRLSSKCLFFELYKLGSLQCVNK